jgi:hypothetical protein
VDHVQAPQQQRDATHQVEKNQTSHVLALPDLRRKIRLSPNAGGSIFYLAKGCESAGLNCRLFLASLLFGIGILLSLAALNSGGSHVRISH